MQLRDCNVVSGCTGTRALQPGLPAPHVMPSQTHTSRRLDSLHSGPRQMVVASSSSNADRIKGSKRLQQLAELDLDDGWSVQPATPSAAPSTQGKTGKTAQTQGKPEQADMRQPPVRRIGRKAMMKDSGGALAPAPVVMAEPSTSTPPPAAGSAKQRRKPATPRSPFVNLQSEQGMMGLAMLQARLEQGVGGGLTAKEVAGLRDKLDSIRAAKAQPGAAGGLAGQAVASRAGRKAGKRVVYVDDDNNIIGEEDEDEDITDDPLPAFSLTIDEGSTEFAEYDKRGNVVRRNTADLPAGDLDLADADADVLLEDPEDDDLDFSGEGDWAQLGKAAATAALVAQPQQDEQEPVDVNGTPLSTREMEALLGGQGAAGVGSLLGGAEEEDEQREWGLEEMKGGGHVSLMEELGVIKKGKKGKEKRDKEDFTMIGSSGAVQWGGSHLGGVPAGADLAEQEALLARMFKPHKAKELLEHQKAAYEAHLDMKKGASTRGKFGNEAKLHKQLRIVAGTAAKKKLVSSQGAQTRPMMEKVRAAIFNMILSQAGSPSELPPNSRWLDLFAGTGSVGLEALSRGAAVTHFVEFDPWVCRNILSTNITACGFNKRSVVHSFKAEQFLRKARDLPRFAGGAFDFISMCPPYLLVSYPELFSLLEGSPLMHDRTIMFVEYPKQLSDQVPDTLGPLSKVRDRKYGRTWIAVYAPTDTFVSDQEEEAVEDELEF